MCVLSSVLSTKNPGFKEKNLSLSWRLCSSGGGKPYINVYKKVYSVSDGH